jgi:hypothetical protein
VEKQKNQARTTSGEHGTKTKQHTQSYKESCVTIEQNPATITRIQSEPRRRPTETKPTAAPACLVRNLSRGLRCATDPARTGAGGVEASSSGKHAGHVATLHHRQLAAHIGEAGVTLVPGVGTGGVGGFAEELHRARAVTIDKGADSKQNES